MRKSFFGKPFLSFFVMAAVSLGWEGVGETASKLSNVISALGTVSCSKAQEAEFVPSWGNADSGETANTKIRLIYQKMYWHNDHRLRWFAVDPASSYEPDAFFYNYYDKKGKPLKGGPAYGKAPSGTWSSNLPYPYVDTQQFDVENGVGGKAENAVTIGSAWAQKIVAKKIYNTFTKMTSDKGSSSWIKLSSQRGRMIPILCDSTHCSFGCNSVSNVPTIPMAKHFSAPGCYEFWFQWQGFSTDQKHKDTDQKACK